MSVVNLRAVVREAMLVFAESKSIVGWVRDGWLGAWG